MIFEHRSRLPGARTPSTLIDRSAHEDLNRHHHVEQSSDRAFGVVFAALFVVIACWPLFYSEAPRWWGFGVAAILALIAAVKPALLTGPNRLWTKLGVLLGNVIGPIAVGVLFYAVVAPLGIAMRLTGKDPLRVDLDERADSYWIPRKPPGPPPDSLTNQF